MHKPLVIYKIKKPEAQTPALQKDTSNNYDPESPSKQCGPSTNMRK